MRFMGARAAAVAGVIVVGLGGCASDGEPMPAACLDGRPTMEAALVRPYGAATLRDGTKLSSCVEEARTDAELQTLGATLTAVADGLRGRARSDPATSERLGYLIGAVRRGAARSNGIALELARRIENTAAVLGDAPGAVRAALARGLRAGEARG